LLAVAGAGALAVAAGLAVAPERTWPNLLIASQYLIGLAVGGLFFVALQYATSAGWSVALRRVPEALAGLLPWGTVAVAAVLLLRPELYPWTDASTLAHDPTHAFKDAWLSRPFFLGRAAVYLGVWLAFGAAIVAGSRRQDSDRDPAHTRRTTRLAIGFVAAFAVTVCLASFDWLMSLEPHWYSTIFGVYNFAGLFASAIAAVIVVTVSLQRLGPRGVGPFHGVVGDAHLHDLGKLLFAFSTFWMYIWFSQYMLIWYASIPEETSYFTARLAGMWEPLFLLNVALNWAVPFAVLLPRGSKRAPRVLVKVALAVLLGRWLDLYLMVVPARAGAAPALGAWELGPLVLVAAGGAVLVLRSLSRAVTVPVGDPFLGESLHHH